MERSQPSDDQAKTLQVQNPPPLVQQSNSSSVLELSSSMSMLLQIELLSPARLHSHNQEKVLHSLNNEKMPLPTESALQDKEICIEDICFEAQREKRHKDEHSGHRTVSYNWLMGELEVLRGNRRWAESQTQQVISLLDELDRVYGEILRFEQEVTKLFHTIKMDAQRHIQDVKQSFSSDYYQQQKRRLQERFDYANVKFALHQIQRFKTFQYPNLDYPFFKVKNIDLRIAQANAHFKIVGVQAINSWIQRLYALEKRDTKVIVNRSVASFLRKTPCQKLMFSYYLKADDYSTNGKRLKRPTANNNNVPIAAVEKELLTGTEVRFRVVALGKGMFIGITPLRVIEGRKFQKCICQRGSYYLTNRGDIVPSEHARSVHTAHLLYGTGDEISIRREQNCVVWRRKSEERGEQEVRVALSLQQYSENYYVCAHFEDTQGILDLLQAQKSL